MLNPSAQKKNSVPDSGKATISEASLNLHDCDREPIHIPGSIQSFGYLAAFTAEGIVKYLSSNIKELNGKAAEDFTGKHLKEILGESTAQDVLERAKAADMIPGRQIYYPTEVQYPNGKITPCDYILHSHSEFLILEIEPKESINGVSFSLVNLNESIQDLQEAKSPGELARLAAKKFRELTGFDRVMVYRFHEDGSGEVIAEAKDRKLKPYLGLRYPASDIPKQARELYKMNPVRIIPDVHDIPVPLCSSGKGPASKPLDMSFTSLRAVSPIHIQYLKNMGVAASMSVAILKGSELKGLIAFHHNKPFHLSYQYRQLCVLLCRVFSMVMAEKEEGLAKEYSSQILRVQAALFARLSGAERISEALFGQEPSVRQLISCGGCVAFSGGEIASEGKVPDEHQVRDLINWLAKNVQEDVFHTNELPKLFAQAGSFREVGSGILAVAISHVQQEYIIWFRPEKIETISWAGSKEKSVFQPGEGGQLNPRKSFEAWNELVRNTSEDWLPAEKEAARALRGFIADMLLRLSGELKLKADILSRINQEVDSETNELDSSSYILSHDLKEPLRGIQQYASFLLEDYAAVLDAPGQAKLHTLIRLSKRMQQLIESLLQFSRAGRFKIKPERVNMDALIQEVLEIFGEQISGEGVKVQTQKSFPAVLCDSLLAGQIFTNLISNALKYNEKRHKEIVIGYRKALDNEISPSGYVFFVRDNGIGIHPQFHDKIFNIFRRLHAREAFGGGTGAGLSITKKIIERHGGHIWVESNPKTGSVFYFTL